MDQDEEKHFRSVLKSVCIDGGPWIKERTDLKLTCEQREKLENSIRRFLSILPEHISHEGKARLIYEILAASLTYDDALNPMSYYYPTAFYTHTGVCIAFAELFSAICKAAGIECEIIVGAHVDIQKDLRPAEDIPLHAWNQVRLDTGEGMRWYHCDLVPDSQAKKAGMPCQVFGRSDVFMKENHYVWLEGWYHVCEQNGVFPEIPEEGVKFGCQVLNLVTESHL